MQTTLELCPNPVFIIGAPRSATTALAHALAKHSRLWTSSESQILADLFTDKTLSKNYKRAEHGGGGSWLVDHGIERNEFLRFVGVGFNALFTTVSEGLRWIDHTPNYTFLAFELAQMFPGALFLHMLRDARRVVHSMVNYRAEIVEKGEARFLPVQPWSRDFAGACKAWARYVTRAIDFSEAYPARCLTVINEELVAEPTAGFQRILAFLNETFEEAPVSYFVSKQIHSSFPNQTRDFLEDPSQSWSAHQLELFHTETGDAMAAAQRARDAEWQRRTVEAA